MGGICSITGLTNFCTGTLTCLLSPINRCVDLITYISWFFGLIWTLFSGIWSFIQRQLFDNLTSCVPPLWEAIGKGGSKFLNRFGGFTDKIRANVWFVDRVSALVASVLRISAKVWEVSVKATTLLPWIPTLLFWYTFWYFTGTAGLLLPVFVTDASLRVDTVVTAVVTIGNIFLVFQGYVNFILNILRPFLNVITSFFMSIIVQFARSISLVGTAIDDNRRADARNLEQDASFYSANPTFAQLEQIWGSLLSSFAFTFAVGLQVALIIYTWFSRYAQILFTIINALGTGGFLSGVCFAKSPGCGILTLIRGIFLVIGLDIGSCSAKDLRGLPCECSTAQGGPYKTDTSCRPPTYSCRQNANGLWVETKSEEVSVLEGTKITEKVGPIKEVVCARSTPSGIRRQQARRLLDNLDDCTESCLYEHGLSFAFVKCGDETFLRGDCDGGKHRRLEGELWKEHLKKFKKHSNTRETFRPPPEPQSPAEKPETITREDFIKKIQQIEDSPSPGGFLLEGCNTGGAEGIGYQDFAWRTACIVVKSAALKIPRGLSHSLPTKQLGHIWRGLHEGHNIHQVLDNIALTHNEHFPDDELPTNHVESRRALEEMVQITHKRSLDAVELMKQINVRNLLGEAEIDDYRCPGTGVIVKSNRLSDCKAPSDEQLLEPGVAIDYALYYVTSLEQQLDPGTLLKNSLDCWLTVFENPARNPGSIQGLANAIATGNEDQFIYCFPAFGKLPYPGKFTFSWNQFVKDQCQPRPGIDGTIYPCENAQYDDTLNVVNCYDKWTTFAPQCLIVRLYNSWIALQWLITRAPIGWFNSIWATIWSLAGASDQVVNAFSPQQAEGGRSDSLNWLLFFLHFYSLIWLALFILVPFYLAWAYFRLPIYVLIKQIGVEIGGACCGKQKGSVYNWCRRRGCIPGKRELDKHDRNNKLALDIITKAFTA